MATSLRSGLNLYSSPNWTTKFSLVQNVNSGCLVLPRIKGVPVVFLQAKLLDVEGKGKTQSSDAIVNKCSCTPTG